MHIDLNKSALVEVHILEFVPGKTLKLKKDSNVIEFVAEADGWRPISDWISLGIFCSVLYSLSFSL